MTNINLTTDQSCLLTLCSTKQKVVNQTSSLMLSYTVCHVTRFMKGILIHTSNLCIQEYSYNLVCAWSTALKVFSPTITLNTSYTNKIALTTYSQIKL